MFFFYSFPYISVAEGDIYSMEMFLHYNSSQSGAYKNETKHAARWVLDKAEVGLLKHEESSLLTANTELFGMLKC